MKSVRCGRFRARESGPVRALLTRAVALAAVLGSSAVLRAQPQASPAAVEARPAVLRPERTESAYSVELPLVVRSGVETAETVRFIDSTLQFNVTLQTSVDLINNTSASGVLASYQFSYTCVASTCSPQGGFYRTLVQQTTLPGLGVFHQDDFVHYLATLGVLQPGADHGAVGTLLVTFSNLGSSRGWEANAIGTTYSPVFGNNPLQGSAGFAYNASLFFDSAESTLVGFARDTTASPTVAGSLQSEVGIRNTDILGTNQNVTVDLSFYDTATGSRVGTFVTLADIRPGELRQVADVWTSAGIASTVTSVIVFADARNPMAFSPTIEGFVLIDEIHKSPRFLTMLCADLDGCGN
jgi:hypothetical protein